MSLRPTGPLHSLNGAVMPKLSNPIGTVESCEQRSESSHNPSTCLREANIRRWFPTARIRAMMIWRSLRSPLVLRRVAAHSSPAGCSSDGSANSVSVAAAMDTAIIHHCVAPREIDVPSSDFLVRSVAGELLNSNIIIIDASLLKHGMESFDHSRRSGDVVDGRRCVFQILVEHFFIDETPLSLPWTF